MAERLARAVLVAGLVAVLGTPALGAAPTWAGGHRGSPAGGFTTADGAVLVGVPADTEVSTVRGWATTRRAEVERVRVTFCPGSRDEDGGWTCGSTGSVGAWSRVRATLECRHRGRECDWSAAVPTSPGRYVVLATVHDDRDRTRVVGPVEVVVV